VKAPVRVETARLVMAPPRAADAGEIFERYASDPEVTKFVGWPRHRSLEDTEAFLKFSAIEWARSPAGPYSIRLREDGRLVGGTGLSFDDPEQAMTGYVFARGAWGKGYATEALLAMVGLARDLGVVRLYALCHPEHRPSYRVLEKCGFVRDRSFTRKVEFPNLAPGVLQDTLCYEALLRPQDRAPGVAGETS
jgi:ribosomal-protein-alanine N-acetyltransferase